MKSTILAEDKDILVCYKPPGIAVQSARLGETDMVSELKNYLGGKNPYLGVVHRLDQPVSGILVFAKTPAAAAALSRQASHETGQESGKKKKPAAFMEKEYCALVFTGEAENLPEPGLSVKLEDYLLRDGRKNTSAVVAPGTKDAKRAELVYELKEKKEKQALVKIRLLTGRHHQIRVQFAHAGLPLLGDARYGTEKAGNILQEGNNQHLFMCLPPEFLSSGNRQKDGFSDGGASMDQLTERNEQEKSVENKDKGTDWFFGNIRDAAQFLTGCWMFLMLTIFPLYFGNKYHEIGGYKFSFFSGTSTLILFPAAVLAVVVLLGKMMKRDCGEWRKEISLADIGVLLYMGASAISFVLSDFRTDAWEGVSGWNMGLRTQLLMGASYFLISRFFPWKNGKEKRGTGLGGKVILYGFFAGSGITFILGILNRFGVDPLGMYKGISSSYQILFLSTIGQATWYSSYVCTVFAIGLCIFFAAKSNKIRIASGLYCVLGFMTLVTQNSDSAFASLVLLFTGLFVAACGSPDKMERFLETAILGAASFKAIGFLQWGFSDRALELGRLSVMFSRGWLSWLLLLFFSICLIVLLQFEEKKGKAAVEKEWGKWKKKLRLICIIGVLSAAVLALLLIIGNTAGLWEKWFGITFHNQYLLFDNKWGSDRGFTWKAAAGMFAEMTPLRKLFGAGPDCFKAYSYSIPEYADLLYQYWKPNILTNAHNEFLNLLICIGIVGLFAFLAMLGMGVWRFFKAWEKISEGTESIWLSAFVLAGMLSILAYAGHNFFCYQQVCCTPFLFIVMGLAESAVRINERKHS